MRRARSLLLLSCLALSPAAGRAQVALSLERLTGPDVVKPVPANLVVIDIRADVAATDAWTAAGVRAVAGNGAALVYAPGGQILNPFDDDPTKFTPFVTCLSKPSARDAAARFFSSGAAVAGRFEPTGAVATASASELNAVWFASPPASSTTPSQDGYIARLVLDISSVAGIDASTIAITLGLPPIGSVPLLISQPVSGSLGTVAATFDVPVLSGLTWNVHATPTARDTTVFRYSFSSKFPLPVVPDQSSAGHSATAGAGAALSSEVPPDGPASAGNRSLDCHASGAVTQDALLLSNDAVAAAGGFTMEAWFQWKGGGSVNSIIDYAGTEKLVIDIRTRVRPAVKMRFGGDTDFNIGLVSAGDWHYVAAVFQAQSRNPDGTITGRLFTYFDDLTAPAIIEGVTKNNFGDSLVRGIGVGQHPLGSALDFFSGLIHEPRVSLGALQPSELMPAVANFRRGDSNDSGTVDIADAIRILSFLFNGATAPPCADAADANDDGRLDISDGVAILGFLFVGSAAPPAPGPRACGSDPTPDSLDRKCGDPAHACGG